MSRNIRTKPDTAKSTMKLTDGLYQVKTNYLCAGFVVEDGVVILCAPILRNKLKYWVTVAERVEIKSPKKRKRLLK